MIKRLPLVSAIAAALMISGNSFADESYNFPFKPIESSASSDNWDPTAPWIIPKGFTQSVVSDETDLNIYDGGRDDWHDMNTVNETGRMAGRFMYRTHELRLPDSLPEGGSVSVVDLKTGVAKLLAQDPTWNAVDGIRWTPWGTILFAEEVYEGRLFEIVLDEKDLMKAAAVIDRPAVGRLAHEGIDLDVEGNVYVVDEHRGRSSGCDGVVPCGGGVYKFVPAFYGDLSNGHLYALKVNGADVTPYYSDGPASVVETVAGLATGDGGVRLRHPVRQVFCQSGDVDLPGTGDIGQGRTRSQHQQQQREQHDGETFSSIHDVFSLKKDVLTDPTNHTPSLSRRPGRPGRTRRPHQYLS